MRFMMFMIPNIPPGDDWMPTAEAVAEMSTYNEELSKAGVLLALILGVQLVRPRGSAEL